jgi:hypothetical protein
MFQTATASRPPADYRRARKGFRHVERIANNAHFVNLIRREFVVLMALAAGQPFLGCALAPAHLDGALAAIATPGILDPGGPRSRGTWGPCDSRIDLLDRRVTIDGGVSRWRFHLNASSSTGA